MRVRVLRGPSGNTTGGTVGVYVGRPVQCEGPSDRLPLIIELNFAEKLRLTDAGFQVEDVIGKN